MGDKVNHPDHYQAQGYEAIDIIEAYKLNFSAEVYPQSRAQA